MGSEVKKCKEWLEEKYGLNICDRFGIIEKVIEYCKESEDYRIEPPEEIQLNNCKESEDYRKGYEYGYKTATEIIESITYLKSKKNNFMKKKTIIPFDLEMAKKIQSGEIEGRIITKKGNTARIICFDAESACNYSIIGLVKDSDSNFEECCRYFTDGTRDRENDELNSLVIELFVYPVNENIIEPPEEK